MPDRFDTIQAFVAVCDLQGFAPAARRLGVSPSVVTRLISALENRLGVRLLQRTTRSVRLTGAGDRFLAQARRILADVEEAEASAQDEQSHPRGRLVVAAPLLFGRMHVAPVVTAFLAAHPQTSADLRLSDRFANLVEDGVDVAVRIGNLPPSGLIARRLGQTRRVLVASPAYLDLHGGPPETPADLVRHQMISFQTMTRGREWEFRQLNGDTVTISIEPRFVTDSGDVAISHAIQGGGITSTFSYQVDAALRSATLVQVLEHFNPVPIPIQAVFPSSRLLSRKVRVFLDLLEQAAPRWTFA